MKQRDYMGTDDLNVIASLAQMTVMEVRRFIDDAGIDPCRHLGLWDNVAGQPVAAALVAVCTGWFVFALDEDVTLDDGRQILQWALTRLQEHSHQKQVQINAATQCTDTDTLKLSLLTQAGFSPITPTQYSMVLYLEQGLENAHLSESYQLRPLDLISDFHAYQDLAQVTFGYHINDVRWESMITPWNVNMVISTVASGKEILISACRGVIRDEESALGPRKGLIADLGNAPRVSTAGIRQSRAARMLGATLGAGSD